MKRCPECRRDYYDDSLMYCLDDGSPLVYGASGEGFAAALLPVLDSQDEAYTLRFKDPTALVDPSKSIAVLPFSNLSADAANEYFCDGLAEELLNALAKVERLKVAARTSAFAFKNT